MSFEIIIQATINGLLIGCIYALSALGLTLIWGTMEIINFAHGSFLMLGMYVSFWIFTLLEIDPLFSLPIVFILFFLFGILFYKCLLKSVIFQKTWFSQILLTYGLGIFLVGFALYFWSPNYKLVQGNVLQGAPLILLGVHIGFSEFYVSVISLLCMAALFFFLNRTKMGRAIKATSINKEAASLVGINIEYIFTLVLGLGIALVGVTGALLSNFYYIFPEIGGVFGTLAFVVVAIGGFGSIQGAVYGGILLGLVTSLSGILIGSPFKYAIAYSLYLIVMYFKPKGLKGW